MVWRVNICLQLLFSFPSKAPENLLVLLETYNSGKCFLERSRGGEFWRRAGSDKSMCNHQFLSLFNSSGLWEGW